MNNIGLAGSFTIGGLVLLTLMYIFFKFTDSAHSQMTNEFTQSGLTTLSEIMDYDFNKIGYRVNTSPKITQLNDSTIAFLADLDNNGTTDTISYASTFVNGSRFLTRSSSENAVKQWQVPIDTFIVQGYDSLHNTTNNIYTVNSLELTVLMNNNDFNTGTDDNFGSFYKRRYFIKN